MPPDERRRNLLKAVVASTVGTSIEWYDYFLFGTAGALVFAKLFFPKSDQLAGTLNVYVIFFAGFLARTIGAWLFGTYGDRIGRKATLIATLLFMGVATFLIGVMPTYATLGLWAAVILVVLRLCQGIGVGGEWGGSVLLAMEWGSRKRKGWLGSWPQFGVPIGLVLANAIVALTVTLAGEKAFLEWAWRIPFLLSIVLVGVGLYIRLGIVETPVFQALLKEQRLERAPVREVVRRNWREIVLSALLRMPEPGAVLPVHRLRLHLRRRTRIQQTIPDLGCKRRGPCLLLHDPALRLPVRRDRSENHVHAGHRGHGGVGLRLLRPVPGGSACAGIHRHCALLDPA